jgi:hypothetical protein
MVAEAEAMGIELRLRDGRVKASFQPQMERELTPILAKLKANRKEVVEVLQLRAAPPPMPPGVRLVKWSLKPPPVILERWSVVTDVGLFARRTLEQLVFAQAGKNWFAGNWSIRELVDRLEAVGVVVEVEPVRSSETGLAGHTEGQSPRASRTLTSAGMRKQSNTMNRPWRFGVR